MNWSYVIAFAGFSALIILHEAGHFIAAKLTGMKATRFFLFFPPKLVSFKRGGTEYGIGAVPLGGFVKIVGMTPEELDRDQEEVDALSESELAELADDRERAYYNQPVWKRIVVIFAGPAVNFAIAFALFAVVASGFGLDDEAVNKIGVVNEELPAAKVLREGDEILAIDGRSVAGLRGSELTDIVRDRVGSHTCKGKPELGCEATSPVRLEVSRAGEARTVSITPEYSEVPISETEVEGRMLVGFGYEASRERQSLGEGISFSFERMWDVTSQGVFGILPRVFNAEKRDEISSVVGIYEVTRQSVEVDARLAVSVLAAISMVLAVMNLMPFLPLDGGHIAWALGEKLRGRRIPMQTMVKLSSVGIVFLIFIVFIGLSNDIGRLTGEGFNVR